MTSARMIRWLRLGLWTLVALCLGLFLYARYASPDRSPRVDYAALARAGDPIVQAIYRFHADCGLWPEFTADLAPAYLSQPPDPAWYLSPGRSLLRETPSPRTFIRFDFSPDADAGGAGWKKVDADGVAIPLGFPTPAPVPATLPADRLLARALAEYDRRIARTQGHDVMEHYRGKAALLHRAGQTAALQQTLHQALIAFPDHWWPRLAQAMLSEGPVPVPATLSATTGPDTHPAATAPAEDRPGPAFVAWVRAAPSFPHYFYLAWYYQQRGQLSAMADALRQAAQYPLEVDVDDPARHDFYAFAACRMAYQTGDMPLLLSLVQGWEARAAQGELHQDASFMAFRAAGELRLGHLRKAAEDMTAAVARNRDEPLWAEHLPELAAAVERGDTHYRWDPGTRVPAFDVFPEAK